MARRVEVKISLDLDDPAQEEVHRYLAALSRTGRNSPKREIAGWLICLGYRLFSGKIPVVIGDMQQTGQQAGQPLAALLGVATLPTPDEVEQLQQEQQQAREEIADVVVGFGFQ